MWLDPVFFSSRCAPQDGSDQYQYCTSVAEGVEFAKGNNLLGVLFDSELLVRMRDTWSGS